MSRDKVFVRFTSQGWLLRLVLEDNLKKGRCVMGLALRQENYNIELAHLLHLLGGSGVMDTKRRRREARLRDLQERLIPGIETRLAALRVAHAAVKNSWLTPLEVTA